MAQFIYLVRKHDDGVCCFVQSQSMNPPRFPSKRDPWLVAVLVLSALACVLAVPAAVEGGSGVTMLAPLPVLLLGAGLPLWVLFATHYRFDADSLCCLLYTSPSPRD